jgi:hypothetical protein
VPRVGIRSEVSDRSQDCPALGGGGMGDGGGRWDGMGLDGMGWDWMG